MGQDSQVAGIKIQPAAPLPYVLDSAALWRNEEFDCENKHNA